MKFIITESQHNRLLSEQKIYTNWKEYKKALERYKNLMIMYNFFKEGESFFKTRIEPMLNQRKWKEAKQFAWHPSLEPTSYNFPAEIKTAMTSLGDNFWGMVDYVTPNDKKGKPGYWDYIYDDSGKMTKLAGVGYRKMKKPEKPVFKEPEKKQTPKPPIVTPPVNNTPIVTPPVNNTPIVTPPKKEEPIKTNFSATFGQDGKQETRYFKNFDEWKRFDDSVRGKFGYVNSKYNQSETEASVLLKGVPSDWGL